MFKIIIFQSRTFALWHPYVKCNFERRGSTLEDPHFFDRPFKIYIGEENVQILVPLFLRAIMNIEREIHQDRFYATFRHFSRPC